MTTRRTAAPSTARRRGPSLAPEHVGEAGAVALIGMTVGGIALLITGLAMIVSGLTMGARYPTDPPPNVDQLGVAPVLGGVGLVVLAIALLGSAVAVVADVARSRLVAGGVSGLAALLAGAGTVLVVIGTAPDVVLASALAVATLVFAAAAVLLLRARR